MLSYKLNDSYHKLLYIKKTTGIDVYLYKVALSSDLITALCSSYFHIFEGKYKPITKPNYLWVSMMTMNDFSRNMIISSVIKNRYDGNQIYYMITCIIISMLNGYNSNHFDGIIGVEVNTVLNINKYWIHIVNGYILKNKNITTAGIFGLIHETGYIGYRLKFKNCNKDKPDYDGVLPKQFNHNAVYHINWAIYNYILFKAYKSKLKN